MTREELEKRILEILTRDRIGSHSPHKHLEDFAKEIASLIEQKPDCYPAEFIGWIVDEMQKGRLWWEDSDNTYNLFDEDYDYTLDELFIYWQTNIKDK